MDDWPVQCRQSCYWVSDHHHCAHWVFSACVCARACTFVHALPPAHAHSFLCNNRAELFFFYTLLSPGRLNALLFLVHKKTYVAMML